MAVVIYTKKENKIKLMIIIAAILISLLIINVGLSLRKKEKKDTRWVLKSYGNSVALFNGENLIEVYGNIVLDTLPEADQKQLDNGIAFISKDEAEMAIEDYDG